MEATSTSIKAHIEAQCVCQKKTTTMKPITTSTGTTTSTTSKYPTTSTSTTSTIKSTTVVPCTDTLPSGKCMGLNTFLCSPLKCFNFFLQNDGNLVIYNTVAPLKAYWNAQRAGKGGVKACMLANGSFTLYNANNTILWSTNSPYYTGANLTVTNNGRITIMSGGQVKLYLPGTASSCVSPATTKAP